MRALVVDDSRTMRTILGRILKQLGFEIAEAGDGREALTRLDGGGFDLALVDWNMPTMNGYELVCAVRANHAWDAMRIVMVTTESDTTYVDKAMAAGANQYVAKPFTAEALSEKLALMGIGPTP